MRLFGIPFESIFMFFFILMFALTLGMIIFTIIKSVARERKNNASPVLNVQAQVVSRRTAVYRRSNHTMTTNMYYLTFQVQSGDRIELPVDGMDYGQLVEGDRGMLTFQGTRFLSFERQ